MQGQDFETAASLAMRCPEDASFQWGDKTPLSPSVSPGKANLTSIDRAQPKLLADARKPTDANRTDGTFRHPGIDGSYMISDGCRMQLS